MSTPSFKYGNGVWATKEGSSLAYNDDNGHYKPLPFNTERASTATRVNKEGLIEVVGQDKLRIDYFESANGVALLEPSRTNLFTYSEAFDNAAWTKNTSTVTADSTTSPDGSVNAYTLTQSGAGGYLREDVTLSGSETASFFVKANSVNFVSLFSGGNEVYFDLINGIATSSNGTSLVSYSIDSFGNGWYRCTITTSYSGATSIRLYPSESDGAKGTSVGSIYIWGAQLEAGSYATSYIPTSGSTATRQADVANGAGVANVFNDSEGVLYVDAIGLSEEGDRRISLNDGTTNNRIFFYYSPSGGDLFGFVVAGGTTQAGMYAGTLQLENSKLAIKYKANDCAIWANGFEMAVDVVSTMPTGLSEVGFNGGGAGGAAPFYGKAKAINVYQTALTDAELEYLTSYRSLAEMVTELNLNAL